MASLRAAEETIRLTVVAPGVSFKDGETKVTADSKLGMLYTAVAEQLILSAHTPRHGEPKPECAHDDQYENKNDANGPDDRDGGRPSGQPAPCPAAASVPAASRVLPMGPVVEWVHKRRLGGRWDLLLSEAQGQSVPWKKLGSTISGPPPLINFSRGFKAICRKSQLVKTLRSYGVQCPEAGLSSWFPQSFIFSPARPEESERGAFLEAFQAIDATGSAAAADGRTSPTGDPTGEAAAVAVATSAEGCEGKSEAQGGGDKQQEEGKGEAESKKPNLWILKPSDGGKGEGIEIMSDADEILAFLDARPSGSIAWVVSRYIERPLLLPGRRKFDWRLWVLLAPDYSIHLYKEGVLRTCSVPYDLSNVSDVFAHLSNHCIQVNSQAYGEFESTNEMFYDEFSALLGAQVFEEKVLPQARHIIKHTLLSVRDTLEVDVDLSGYAVFNVFGFDLMIDEDLKVWLIEVNSSPAVADQLLPELSKDLVDSLILPYFSERDGVDLNPQAQAQPEVDQALELERDGSGADGSSEAQNLHQQRSNGWEVIYKGSSGSGPHRMLGQAGDGASTTSTETKPTRKGPSSSWVRPSWELRKAASEL